MFKRVEKKKIKIPAVKSEEKPKTEEAAALTGPIKSVPVVEALRGFKDIMPQEAVYWQWIEARAREIAAAYGFGWVETPILESSSLFVRSIGRTTDIVEKEMFRFLDQGGDDVALRPENTAGLVRAYISHGLLNQPQPVKLWYWGPMFRHDRPQAGRYREFHQWGCETFGETKPIADAELILVGWGLLRELGLNLVVSINSIGDPASRETYKEQLVNWYRQHRTGLCEDCKRRLQKNPLRLLDCKEEGCRAIRGNAPQILDALNEESKNHFMRVLEYLDEAEVSYALDPYLVRGLDYYNRTVFEFVISSEEERAQAALGGGGRYDGLVELLGGRPTPAVGFALGIERVILALKAANINPPAISKADVFLAQLGEPAKRKSLILFEEFRRAGLSAIAAFPKDSLKSQLELANKAGVRFTVIIGQKEILDGTVIIRDMESGVQETHDQKKLIAELKRKLETVASLPSTSQSPNLSEPELETETEIEEKTASPEESLDKTEKEGEDSGGV